MSQSDNLLTFFDVARQSVKVSDVITNISQNVMFSFLNTFTYGIDNFDEIIRSFSDASAKMTTVSLPKPQYKTYFIAEILPSHQNFPPTQNVGQSCHEGL